jgi:predicted RNA binding protein with dsRBD fold (UPF0201 family)
MKILGTGSFANNEEEAFLLKYYTNVLKHWTRPECRDLLVDDHLSDGKALGIELPKKEKHVGRRRLTTDLRIAGSKGNQVHGAMLTRFLAALKLFIKGNDKGEFQWIVRVNAMLMLGELNDVEPAAGVSAQPSADALNLMLEALADDKQIEGVKVAALVGLHRNASVYGAEDKKRVATAMLNLIKAPLGETPTAGQCWMRKQAAEVLASMGSSGPIVQTLQEMLLDKALPLSHRCAIAEAMGGREFDLANAKPGPLVQALGGLVVEVLKKNAENSYTAACFKPQIAQIYNTARKVSGADQSDDHKKLVPALKRILDDKPPNPKDQNPKSPAELALEELEPILGS